ncbi:MAG: hypothetical protein M3Q77_03190 [Thermoproteota archaeon]|nr:hypothetical protein [Nitrosopumilus sp.]MDQ3083801.1 hypothetical protein [Thermoproteota archaeon]
MSHNPMRMREFLDNNSPFSYFFFEGLTHELIIDFDEEILVLRPSNDDRKSHRNEFEKSGGNLLYLNFLHDAKEKSITITDQNGIEIIHFNYLSYFKHARF